MIVEKNQQQIALLEAIFFVADKPLTLEKIFTLIDQKIPVSLLEELLKDYEQILLQEDRGFFLQQSSLGYQLKTKKEFHEILTKFYTKPKLNLTPAALEVLSLIAYKQPLLKTELDQIRGVDSSYLLRVLLEKRMIQTAKSQQLSYETTADFLDFFQLRSLEDLPSEQEVEELVDSRLIEQQEGLKNLIGLKSDPLFEEGALDTSKLENLVKERILETDLTKEMKQKGAFEALEQYLLKQEVILQNRLSLQTEENFT